MLVDCWTLLAPTDLSAARRTNGHYGGNCTSSFASLARIRPISFGMQGGRFFLGQFATALILAPSVAADITIC
jgi:hypothetical protein